MNTPIDKILVFAATYVVPSGELGRVREEDSVNLYIDVVESCTFTGYIGQVSVLLDDSLLDLVGTITIDGVETPFELQRFDKRAFWATPLTKESTVVVTLARNSGRFSLLSGTLPPGLSLSPSTGLVSGRVTNITAPPASYAFTIRFANATHTHDRRYTIFAEGKDYPAFFNPAQLQPQVVEPEFGFSYVALQPIRRGQGYAVTLDIFDPDGVLPGFVLRKISGFRPNSGKFGGLPQGLSIIGQTIQGVSIPDACPGKYFFEIVLNDGGGDGSIFMIEVIEQVTMVVGVIPSVVWDTPAGSLGAIEETEACYYEVAAHSVNAPDVVYSLAPYSSPLPAGLTVNPITGRIYGVLPYVDSDTVFSFRMRATAGPVFTDRIFEITVISQYDLSTIHQLRLKLRLDDESTLVPLYQDAIPEEMIFRPEDPNFGLVPHPYVYVIKGIDGSIDLETALRGNEGVKVIDNKDYHNRFKLILGNHRFAYARDSQGKVIYEVLYRDLFDPLAKAGGFRVEDEKIVAAPVRWPQSGPVPSYIFPRAVKNMRADLIHDIGFAMLDETERHRGTGTDELLPLWMRSEQVAGVAASVPGFQTSLFIAYLKPGSVVAMTKIINDMLKVGSLLTQWGHVYHFDKYFTTETANVYQMSLDNQDNDADQTVVDSPDTIFDEVDGDVVKYLD